MLVVKAEAFKVIVLPTFDGVHLIIADSEVLQDPALFLEKQVNAASKKAFSQLHASKMAPYLDSANLASWIYVMVTWYCNSQYIGLPLKSTWRFQLVQNAAAHLLSGTS